MGSAVGAEGIAQPLFCFPCHEGSARAHVFTSARHSCDSRGKGHYDGRPALSRCWPARPRFCREDFLLHHRGGLRLEGTDECIIVRAARLAHITFSPLPKPGACPCERPERHAVRGRLLLLSSQGAARLPAESATLQDHDHGPGEAPQPSPIFHVTSAATLTTP